MKKNDFIVKLIRAFNDLSEDDVTRICEYYNEIICDGVEQGQSEEKIIEGFGSIDDIVKKFREDYEQLSVIEKKEHVEQAVYKADQPIHTIRIKSDCISISARPSASDKLRVLFEPREGIDRVTCGEENGVFNFEHSINKFYIWKFIGLNILEQNIIVEIPDNFEGELNLISSCANITTRSLKNLKLLSIRTSNARISAEDLSSEDMEIASSNGSLELKRLSGKTLIATTSNGRITANDCTMERDLRLDTSNAKIEISEADCDHIDLKSSNGPIKGTIVGDMRDFAITSRTINASNNLPNMSYPDQKKILTVKTSNAKINIDFVKKI